MPSWHHAAWECSHHAGTRAGLAAPLCKLQARMGWAATGSGDYDRAVLHHLGVVRSNLLAVRYAD